MIINHSRFFLMVLMSTTLLFGCRKSDNISQVPTGDKTMEQLVVNNNFNWATTNDVAFEITARDNADQPLSGVRFNIYTASPDSGGIFLFSGNTDNQGVFNLTRSLPAYLVEVVITNDFIGLIREMHLKIQSNQVKASFGGKSPNPVSLKSVMTGVSVTNGIIWKFMSSFDGNGVPSNLLPVNDVIDQPLLNDLNATLPERVSLLNSHPEFLADQAPTNLELTQEADVWITYITEGAGWRNSIGYFIFNTNTPPANPQEIEMISIIFPNLSNTGSGGGLNPGNKVYLGKIPAGKSVGFVVIQDGWPNHENSFNNGKDVYYSIPSLNPDYSTAMKKHIILLRDISRSKFTFSFDDQRISQGSDRDYNDGIMYLTVQPVSAVNNTNMPVIITTQVDRDNDGVVDTFDEYPDDATKAFNNYYPGKTTYGSLAFEDLWPGKGDYDFNDLVVTYRFNQITNGLNKVVVVEATLITEAMGAYYHNGFGFQIPVNAGQIGSVTGTSLLHGIVSTNPNGTEAQQTKAVIMAYDDAYDRIPSPSIGVGTNTEKNAPYVTPDVMNIIINMTEPVAIALMGNPPYNPFIFINGNRSIEVHLPDMPPTDKASQANFGTGDDNSKPAEGRYYKTKSNLPWALNLADKFQYVYERQPVNQGYLHFNEWAESSGSLYPDWFKTLTSGYRDNSLIYTHQ